MYMNVYVCKCGCMCKHKHIDTQLHLVLNISILKNERYRLMTNPHWQRAWNDSSECFGIPRHASSESCPTMIAYTTTHQTNKNRKMIIQKKWDHYNNKDQKIFFNQIPGNGGSQLLLYQVKGKFRIITQNTKHAVGAIFLNSFLHNWLSTYQQMHAPPFFIFFYFFCH